jgi:predicted HAD superfamily Cof-like phosphohydrolase
MNEFIDNIEKFHERFANEYNDYARALSKDEKSFRVTCLREECDEYEEAATLEDELDALIDLVYFALGTAYRHGFDFEAAWKRVHAANMLKVRANTARDSKRGSSLDVVKPKGWKAPDLSDIVNPPPNPALVSPAGGVYAKKRKNLTESKMNDIVKHSIGKKGSERENIESAEG